MLPLQGDYFTLISPHSPEECANRLRTAITCDVGVSGVLAGLSNKPLLGEASSEYIRIRKRNNFCNAFQPQLSSSLEPYGSGTRLDYRIRLPIASRILLSIAIPVFSLVAVGLGIGALASFVHGEADGTKGWTALSMIAFLIFFIWVGQSLASEEQAFLERTLTETLEAHREGT